MSTHTYTVTVVTDSGRVIDYWAEDETGCALNAGDYELRVFMQHAVEAEAASRQDTIDAKADAQLADRQEARHMEGQK